MAILALPPLIRPRVLAKRRPRSVENINEFEVSVSPQRLDTRKFMLLMASAEIGRAHV